MPPQGRDDLGRFTAAANEAADKLKEFSREVDDSAKASADHTRASKEEAEASKARMTAFGGFAATAGVGAISRAASAEDLDAGLSGLAQAGIKGIRSLPGGDLIAEGLGLGRAERVLGGAAERTLDVTSDMAKYGIEVTDGFRKDLLDTFTEQEERIEKERAKVSGDAFSPARLGEQSAEHLKNMTDILRAIFDKLVGLGGGGGAG